MSWTLSVLDLFSGIGGFSLGLENAGMRTVAFCEINPYARRILAHHWPAVRCFDDVNKLSRFTDQMQGIKVDVICGGFPCQDISLSGSGAGLDGDRSGLWFQFQRLIGEFRPRWAIIENVSALRGRGLDQVLRGLAKIGYDAEWHCVPASALGAPHRRDRIWIVAYPNSEPRHEGRPDHAAEGQGGRNTDRSGSSADTLAHTDKPRLEIKLDGEAAKFAALVGAHDWSAEPDVGRVAYGVPSRVDRLTCLGNAIVPVMAYVIGRAIMEYEG